MIRCEMRSRALAELLGRHFSARLGVKSRDRLQLHLLRILKGCCGIWSGSRHVAHTNLGIEGKHVQLQSKKSFLPYYFFSIYQATECNDYLEASKYLKTLLKLLRVLSTTITVEVP